MGVVFSCPSYTDASAIFGKIVYQFFRPCGKLRGLVAQKAYKAFWDGVRDTVERKTKDISLWDSRVTLVAWGVNKYDFGQGDEVRFFVEIELRFEGQYRCMHISMGLDGEMGDTWNTDEWVTTETTSPYRHILYSPPVIAASELIL